MNHIKWHDNSLFSFGIFTATWIIAEETFAVALLWAIYMLAAMALLDTIVVIFRGKKNEH